MIVLSYDVTHDGRPEWEVMREMEERVAVWLAQKQQAKLLQTRAEAAIVAELERVRDKLKAFRQARRLQRIA